MFTHSAPDGGNGTQRLEAVLRPLNFHYYDKGNLSRPVLFSEEDYFLRSWAGMSKGIVALRAGRLAPCFPVPKIEHNETRGGWTRSVLAGNATSAPIPTPVELFPATALPLSKFRGDVYGSGCGLGAVAMGPSLRKRLVRAPDPSVGARAASPGADSRGETGGPGGLRTNEGAGAEARACKTGRYTKEFVRRQYEMAMRKRRQDGWGGLSGHESLLAGAGEGGPDESEREHARDNGDDAMGLIDIQASDLQARQSEQTQGGSAQLNPSSSSMMLPHSPWLSASMMRLSGEDRGGGRGGGLEFLPVTSPRTMEGLSHSHHWMQDPKDLTRGAPKRSWTGTRDDGLKFPGARGHGVGMQTCINGWVDGWACDVERKRFVCLAIVFGELAGGRAHRSVTESSCEWTRCSMIFSKSMTTCVRVVCCGCQF